MIYETPFYTIDEKRASNNYYNIVIKSNITDCSLVLIKYSFDLCVVSNSNSQTQNGQGNQELEYLDNEFRCLILVVLWLFWWSVFHFSRNCRWIDITDVIVVHHTSCTCAVTNIFKIICCVFPCLPTIQ